MLKLHTHTHTQEKQKRLVLQIKLIEVTRVLPELEPGSSVLSAALK